MGFIRFNRVPTHRKFDYIPRFYDPKKEELDNLVKSHDNLADTEISKERIKSGLRNKYRSNPELKKKGERSSNIRLLSIIIVLFFVSYLLLRSEAVLKMMESFLAGT